MVSVYYRTGYDAVRISPLFLLERRCLFVLVRSGVSRDRTAIQLRYRTGEPLAAALIRDVRYGSLGRTQPMPVTSPALTGACGPAYALPETGVRLTGLPIRTPGYFLRDR